MHIKMIAIKCGFRKVPAFVEPRCFFHVRSLVVATVLLSYLFSDPIDRWTPTPQLTWGLVSRGQGDVDMKNLWEIQ